MMKTYVVVGSNVGVGWLCWVRSIRSRSNGAGVTHCEESSKQQLKKYILIYSNLKAFAL